METTKQEAVTTKKMSEKKKLGLVEKKIEIQKKRLEVRKERMSITKMDVEIKKDNLDLLEKKVSTTLKHLESKKTKLAMEEVLANRDVEAGYLLNDKIISVLFSLIVTTIDTERTILGSEPFYVPLLDGRHKEVALAKLMELIKRT